MFISCSHANRYATVAKTRFVHSSSVYLVEYEKQERKKVRNVVFETPPNVGKLAKCNTFPYPTVLTVGSTKVISWKVWGARLELRVRWDSYVGRAAGNRASASSFPYSSPWHARVTDPSTDSLTGSLTEKEDKHTKHNRRSGLDWKRSRLKANGTRAANASARAAVSTPVLWCFFSTRRQGDPGGADFFFLFNQNPGHAHASGTSGLVLTEPH